MLHLQRNGFLELLRAGGNGFDALIAHELGHRRLRDDGPDVPRDLLHDGGRSAGRCHETKPSTALHALIALFGEGGDIGEHFRAARRDDRQRPDLARPDMRQGRAHRVEAHFQMSAQQVGQMQGLALVRDGHHLDAGIAADYQTVEVETGAVAEVTVLHRLSGGLVADREITQGPVRRIGTDEHHHLGRRILRDRGEVGDRVIGRVGIQELGHGVSAEGRQQRVAIGGRAGDLRRPDTGARTGAVVDDHRLAPLLAEPLGDQAREPIRAAGGRAGQNDPDRLGRPLLRMPGDGEKAHCCNTEQQTTGLGHWEVSLVRQMLMVHICELKVIAKKIRY